MLIGLTGPAGSGKSTCARLMCERGGFIEIAFADPVKDMLGVICSPRMLNGDKSETIEWIGKSGRYLMQTLGTEWGRGLVSLDLWVKIAEARIDTILNSEGYGANVVISDVRFENEADMIRRRGGVILHLKRQGIGLSGHASEDGIAFDPADIEFDNSGDSDVVAAALALCLLKILKS